MKSTKSINLKSSEGKNFLISVAALRHSKLLDTTIEDFPEDNEIFVDVKAEILEKVVEYLIHYEEIEPKEIPEDLIDGNISKIIEPFDLQFMNQLSPDDDLSRCYEVINAANYLDIPSLLNLGVSFVASKLYEKSPEEIKDKLGIESDMDEDEKKEYEKYSIE